MTVRLVGGRPVDTRPLHELTDELRRRLTVVIDTCVCGGPDIRAASHSDADRMAAVQRHQVEPVHIAYDLAHGIPLSRAQQMADALDQGAR